jgi:hypothetical protein
VNIDEERKQAFLTAMSVLEKNEEEYMTVSELQNIMLEEGVQPYASTWIISRTYHHFDNSREVIITKIPGINKDHIVSFKTKHSTAIIEDFFSTKSSHQTNKEKEKKIMEGAAMLVRSETMLMSSNKEKFTLLKDLSSEEQMLSFLPDSVRMFLDMLFSGKDKKKIATIGQLIVQHIRPRSIAAPVALAIGIALHHISGRRDIIDLLYQLGISCSYTDVLDYEKSETISKQNDLQGYKLSSFVQHVVDNADHNTCTIDGKGTFHGMAIIGKCLCDLLQILFNFFH